MENCVRKNLKKLNRLNYHSDDEEPYSNNRLQNKKNKNFFKNQLDN